MPIFSPQPVVWHRAMRGMASRLFLLLFSVDMGMPGASLRPGIPKGNQPP
ncbi:hypothetical protein [Rhizobium sp. SG2393]